MPSSPLPRERVVPFIDHLERESRRFREVLVGAAEGFPVPTCPDWDADDLLWHLGDVQWFWGEIVERRLTTRDEVAALAETRPPRPGDRTGLIAHFDRSSSRLHATLLETPPTTEVWMWADDHSAAYIARRQAHEALVHRIDAELTAGLGVAEWAAMDPALCADGVDEALRIMRGVEPEEGLVLSPLTAPVAISCSDADATWTVTPTRVTGTDSDGDEWDVTRFVVEAAGTRASARIHGRAADLDCWLWNRPPASTPSREGDAQALAAVDRVLTDSID